jgi:uracil-DNA glycosylase
MRKLREFLVAEEKANKRVYPKNKEIFSALNLTPVNKVRVVIIGQDPYHGSDQAHGLCFSVRPGVQCPPSLLNIFHEINDDLTDSLNTGDRSVAGIPPERGCLRPWARQGVLLLNSVLTVVDGHAGSHQGHGWETFTDRVVEVVNAQCDSVVFLLWGSYAQRKGSIVDRRRHLVLSAPHPSPLSAHRGFFGCRHFSSANNYLADRELDPIDWFNVE